MSFASRRAATTGLPAIIAFAVLATPAIAAGNFNTRNATCANAASCTVQFHTSSTLNYPRQVTCYWSQNISTARVRRVLAQKYQTGQAAPGWVLAFPVESQSASTYVFNQIIQTGSTIWAKDGTFDFKFEFTAPVTVTINCTFFYWQ